MPKYNIAVLFGGVSSEHEVSLLSATSVLQNLSKEKYDITCIGITKQGRWLLYPGPIEEIATGQWKNHPGCVDAIISPSRSHKGILIFSADGQCKELSIDCVFPILHGKNGEDGTIQGLLALSGIPFVGCDVLSSAVCMDKDITHRLLTTAGVRNANWVSLTTSDLPLSEETCLDIARKLGFPIFVKPANAGSSVGITKAQTLSSLREGIRAAFAHDSKVVCEEMISGREIECAVLGNDHPRASVLGEIIPCNDFYDYQAKYQSDSTLIAPAKLDEQLQRQIQQTAVKAYLALGCSGLARIDFFLTDQGEIYINEPNTLPGFTVISMYPRLWAESGLPYQQLLDTLINFAIEQQKDRIG